MSIGFIKKEEKGLQCDCSPRGFYWMPFLSAMVFRIRSAILV